MWAWYGDLERKGTKTGRARTSVGRASDDMNTPKAIAAMHELHSAGKWGELRAALGYPLG